MNNFVRVGFAAKEFSLVKKRAKELDLSTAKYFRMLFVADIMKNG